MFIFILLILISPFLLFGFSRAQKDYHDTNEQSGWWGWLFKNHRKKCVFLLLLIVPQIILGSLNYSEVCISKGRIMSDEEKIDLAIKATIQSGPLLQELPSDLENKYFKMKDHRYKSLEEFKKLNPNCCKVTKKWNVGIGGDVGDGGFFDIWFGGQSQTLIISYKARFIDDKGNHESTEITEYPSINNCGRVENRP